MPRAVRRATALACSGLLAVLAATCLPFVAAADDAATEGAGPQFQLTEYATPGSAHATWSRAGITSGWSFDEQATWLQDTTAPALRDWPTEHRAWASRARQDWTTPVGGSASLWSNERTVVTGGFRFGPLSGHDGLGRMRVGCVYGRAYALSVGSELLPGLNGIIRAGAFRWHVRHEFEIDDLGAIRGTELFVGSGARWRLSPSMAMTAAWDWYRVEGERTHLVTLGLLGEFGGR